MTIYNKYKIAGILTEGMAAEYTEAAEVPPMPTSKKSKECPLPKKTNKQKSIIRPKSRGMRSTQESIESVLKSIEEGSFDFGDKDFIPGSKKEHGMSHNTNKGQRRQSVDTDVVIDDIPDTYRRGSTKYKTQKPELDPDRTIVPGTDYAKRVNAMLKGGK